MPSDNFSILGIDFSAAQDAAARCWLTRIDVAPESIRVARPVQVKSLPTIDAEASADSLALDPRDGTPRAAAHAKLVASLVAWQPRAIGIDLPLSLPRALIPDDDWLRFITTQIGAFASAEAFREACWEAAGQRELRRATDLETHTPFSPYNLRMYRQTFFGLRDVVRPLVEAGMRCVPLQRRSATDPMLIEVCPASTLKRLGLYAPYKGRAARNASNRRSIARSLRARLKPTGMRFAQRLWSTVVADAGGDGLDSLLAALAAWHADQSGKLNLAASRLERIEGRVYCDLLPTAHDDSKSAPR